ncbi:MAG: DUF4810 domain-containing protein [Nitrospirota bacterium]|nr:DUF4810 domain-containing protein [Nitrospirota bacterium]
MIRARTLLLATVVLLGTTGCTTTRVFHWGGYESALYHYYKSPDSLDRYAASLEVAVREGRRSNRTAPGLYAEYGYVLHLLGRPAEALSFFELEKATWPESGQLMDIMIRNITPEVERSRTAPDSAARPSPGTEGEV